jgi:hypothetical protein
VYEGKLLSGMLALWNRRAFLEQTVEAQQRDQAKLLLAKTFDTWRQLAGLHSIEREIVASRGSRLLGYVLDHWRKNL